MAKNKCAFYQCKSYGNPGVNHCEFSCPGCRSSYIGKTDRTRKRKNSEIYAHVNSCEHFQHIKSLLELSPHLSNPICTSTTQLIFNNCKVIDKSDHWSLLLFKESLAIKTNSKPRRQSFKRAYYISITPPPLL